MTEKEIEILADKIIVRVPNVKSFEMGHEIDQYFKSINSETIVNNKIMESVIDFMREQQYIEDRPGEISEILTTKGIKVKAIGGHFKYLDSLKPKKEYWLTNYQIIYLLFFILFGFFGIYKYSDNKELKSQYDNVKSDFEILKKKYDSVLKQKEELPKEILNDSLHYESSDDLTKR